VRADAYFGFGVVSRYINPARFTRAVWHELLRLSHFLVATRDVGLVFRRLGPDAHLEAHVDSSLGTGPDRRSFGGYLLRLGCGPHGPHSAPLAWTSSLPAQTVDSSGAAELFQVTRCTKAILGMRIFLRELRQQHLVADPTPMYTGAQVVLDGMRCRRVSRESKWISTRYAMVRKAENDGAIEPRKCDTADNDANMLTKPVVGAEFPIAQARMMNLPGPAL
jgi:hypothetical protein